MLWFLSARQRLCGRSYWMVRSGLDVASVLHWVCDRIFAAIWVRHTRRDASFDLLLDLACGNTFPRFPFSKTARSRRIACVYIMIFLPQPPTVAYLVEYNTAGMILPTLSVYVLQHYLPCWPNTRPRTVVAASSVAAKNSRR